MPAGIGRWPRNARSGTGLVGPIFAILGMAVAAGQGPDAGFGGILPDSG